MTDNAKGVIFMMIGIFGFVVNDTFMKALFSDYPLFQIIFLRGVFCVPLLIAVMVYKGVRLARYARQSWVLLMMRAFAEVMATICFLNALKHLPLPNVTAIIQILPLTVTMAAALFLKEPVGIRRWAAIIIGFIGVIIVIKPGAEGFTVYSFYAVLSVLFVTMREIVTRKMPLEVPSLMVTLVTALSVTLLSGATLPFLTFQPVDGPALLLIMSAALAIVFGYLFSIMAMRIGEISLVSQFRYTAMIWAILLGYLVFNDLPATHTVVGSAIIVASGVYAFHRKRVRQAAS